MQKYIFIAATLAFTAFGQLVIKARAVAFAAGHGPVGKIAYLTAMFTDPAIWSGFAAAAAASVCWMLAVQRAPVSLCYPFMALTFLLVPALSVVLFGEFMSAAQMLGLLLIAAGVVVNGLAH
jgi:drug/metabolite transporter (DMT)-like permease